MKLVYVCNEVSKRNGWCVINYHTVDQANKSGHQVSVITSKNADNVSISGVEYFKILPEVGSIGRRPFQFLISFLKLSFLLRRQKPELVHILVEPYLIYFALCKSYRIFLTIVGTYSISIFKKSRFKKIYLRALSKVIQIVSISEYTRSRFMFEVGYRGNSTIQVIPLGVDYSNFSSEENSSNGSRELAFCFVGYIKPRKGLIYVLQALNLLKKDWPQARLYIAGLFDDISYGNLCRNYVKDNGLENMVHFLGRLTPEELKSLYSKCILNVLPSFNSAEGSFEGFGLIHLEANSAGTLTLGTKNSGNESAIVPEQSGFLVAQESYSEIYEKMIKVIDIYNRGEYDLSSLQCRNYAKSCSWEKYFAKLTQNYLEVKR